jgi:glyoxylase-like metal-dependent hydrolase (beta-lactamase superfamily II)
VALTEVVPGLRRWTAWHEEWREDVGCVAVETDDGLVLIDPLDPPRGIGKPDHVLVTVFFHARSTKAPRVWADERMVRRLASRGVEVNRPFVAGDALPGGIQAFETARSGEVVYWLPRQRAVVVGDVLLGAGAKPRATDDPLRMCPERWLGGGATHDDLRESLAPLLELPVSRVLVSHGKPVLRGGARVLADALAG